MKVTGQLLKKARESKNMNLQEVGAILKINPKILEAIEEAHMSELPPKTFVRGFVRSYATYLKLNVKDILRTYQEEMGSTHPITPPPTEPSFNEKANEEGENFPWKISLPFLKEKSKTVRYTILGSIVFLIGLILFIKNLVDKYEKESALLSQEEIAATTGVELQPDMPKLESTVPAAEDVRLENTTPPTPAPDPTPQPVTDNPTTTPQESTPTLSKMATEEIKKPNAELPQKEPETLAQKPQEETKPSEESNKATSTPQEVIVEALDHIEISYYVDNGNKRSVILKPEQIHTFKGKNSIRLEVSDAGAINVIHNGHDKGVPGNIGQEKTLIYK